MIQLALLRGINVGTAKRVAMADLRALVAGLGFTEVRTLLNSGNVVYRAEGVTPAVAAARIEKGMVDQIGVSSRVTVVTANELAKIIADNTLDEPGRNPSRLFVAFPRTAVDLKRLGPLMRETWTPESFALGARAAYFYCPDGLAESRINGAVARAMGDAVTTRNWATVQKLIVMTGVRAGGCGF